MNYCGDYLHGATVYLAWNTAGADGASITRSTNGSIRIYKGNSDTQRSSSNGITDTEDFDSLTGVHMLSIDTSDNSDAGFYAPGYEYHVVLQGATIDTKTVNACIGSFSIERFNMAMTPRTPFASAAPVTFTTANADITGASGSFTTVITGDTYGSVVNSITFRAVTRTPEAGTVIYIYHNVGGTRRNVGAVVVPPGKQHDPQTDVWSAVWTPPQPYLASGDKYDVAPFSGTTVYHAIAAGGDVA